MTETIKWQDLIKQKPQTNQLTKKPWKNPRNPQINQKNPKNRLCTWNSFAVLSKFKHTAFIAKSFNELKPQHTVTCKNLRKKYHYCCCRDKPFKSCPGISKTTMKVRVAALTDKSSPSLCSAHTPLSAESTAPLPEAPLGQGHQIRVYIIKLIKQETKFTLFLHRAESFRD